MLQAQLNSKRAIVKVLRDTQSSQFLKLQTTYTEPVGVVFEALLCRRITLQSADVALKLCIHEPIVFSSATLLRIRTNERP